MFQTQPKMSDAVGFSWDSWVSLGKFCIFAQCHELPLYNLTGYSAILKWQKSQEPNSAPTKRVGFLPLISRESGRTYRSKSVKRSHNSTAGMVREAKHWLRCVSATATLEPPRGACPELWLRLSKCHVQGKFRNVPHFVCIFKRCIGIG